MMEPQPVGQLADVTDLTLQELASHHLPAHVRRSVDRVLASIADNSQPLSAFSSWVEPGE